MGKIDNEDISTGLIAIFLKIFICQETDFRHNRHMDWEINNA